MKKFTKINDAFICVFCGHINPPAPRTCRNHCQKCLKSLHVDKNPGDRAEECGGTMMPIDIEFKRGEMKSIIFRCEKCGMIRKNKIAEDDDRERMGEVVLKKINLPRY